MNEETTQHAVWPPPPTNAPQTTYYEVMFRRFYQVVELGRRIVVLQYIRICSSTFIALGQIFPANAASGRATRETLPIFAMLIGFYTAYTFLKWTYVCYQNIEAESSKPKSTPGLAVAYFFIPIVGLIRPLFVYREIWQASKAERAPKQGEDWNDEAVPSVLYLWWFIWVARLVTMSIEIAQHWAKIGKVNLNFFDYLLSLAGAITTIQVVKLITGRQRQKASALEQHVFNNAT